VWSKASGVFRSELHSHAGGFRAFDVVPITLTSVTAQAANVRVVPSSMLADNADNRVVATITGITDGLGLPAPDGTKIAVTVQQIGVSAPDGSGNVASAGGTIVNGTATPNDSRFRTFEVQGGQVQVVYSTQGVELPVRQTATARLQLLPAAPNGDRIGFTAFIVADITLTGYQTAATTVTPPSAVADGLPKTVTVRLTGIRDTAGNPVPDGARVAVTAQQIGVSTPDGAANVASAGGTITNGAETPNDSRFRTFVVESGAVDILYDPAGVLLSAGQTATANVQVLPARPSGDRIGFQAFAVAAVALSAVTTSPQQIAVVPPSVLADSADNRVTVTVSGIRDAAGRPAPDGTRVAATVQQIGVTAPEGGNVESAGGTIVGGEGTPNDSRFRTFVVQNGQVAIVYSTTGVAAAVRTPMTARLQLLPATGTGIGDRIGFTAFAVAPITLAAYQTADVSGPGTLAPNGAATYTVANIVDTSGNPVPNGSRIAVTAQQIGVDAPDGSGNVASAGGTVLNGRVTGNDSRFRTFTVANGSVEVEFQAPPTAGGTSVLQLLPALPSDDRIGLRAFAVKSIAVGP
jgi:hypothetical protein